MKLKRRRAVEVPSKIRSLIDGIVTTPFENIEEPLKSFVWEFEKGDFHHWVDLFNHFDAYFEKFIKPRKDLQLEDNFLEYDPPFPRDAVLQILRVIRIILENCTNKHFYSSYEHHLSALLASTDADVVEAALQTLGAFLKKTIGKYIIKDACLNSRLFAFAQGWGGKEEGLGLITCAVCNDPDRVAYELGCTLHFEFYSVDAPSTEHPPTEVVSQGLQIIHVPNINTYRESDLQILNKLVMEYKIPPSLRFTLLTRLRFARAFSSLAARQQYTCIRMYAFLVLVQACSDTDDLMSFFNAEPEFINELITLLSCEDNAPEKIQILSLLSLVALCQDRSSQSTVLTNVTSGGHRGILSSLMQKAINSIVNNSSEWSVVFAEALLSLVSVLVSSSSGCSAMREAGFIPTLLPLLKDTDPQHLQLVSTAVHVLEAFMDYINPAAALFRDLGGLDDAITRLKIEVSRMESGSKQQGIRTDLDNSQTNDVQLVMSTSSSSDNTQPFYSEALVAYHRRLLIKALLRAISLGTYAPGSTSRIYGSEEDMLPQCLYIIFRRAKDFGGGVFSLAATVMSDLIHKDPTCFAVLEACGLPSAFMDAIMDGVLCSAEAITCIPQCLDALCLNNSGLQAVKDRNALRCFVNIFTSKTYLRALAGDTPGSLSSGLDELMRHASSLRGAGVDMLIEILNGIGKLGSGEAASSSSISAGCSTPVPMETDIEDGNNALLDDKDLCKTESSEPLSVPSPESVNMDSFLPDYISNAACLLETILQNSDTCRIFVEKKGIESVLQLFTLPSMPLLVSLGHSISVAFKNFSQQHSASLARAVCSLLREHLKSTNELLISVGGIQLAQLEAAMRTKVLRFLYALEGILCLSNSLLKGSTAIVSELGATDADALKDLGKTYKEILWQISLSCDSKMDQKQNVETESEGGAAVSSTVAGRESDDDTNVSVARYMNSFSSRSNLHSQWGVERDFFSVVRSGDGLARRSRHGLARIRGGRTTGRHLEALPMDSEAPSNFVETSSLDIKKRSPDVIVLECLNKLASTARSFFTSLVKGFTSTNRRRAEVGSISSASKSIGAALAKMFLEAFDFSGYASSAGHDIPLSVKCRYLGKVVDDMAALTLDSRRRIYSAMVNNFYVQGTFKELLTTFEATSQLLWTLPCSISVCASDREKIVDGNNLFHSSWLLDTLQSYCRLLECFVNSALLLSPNLASQAQLLVQPVSAGLSIGLFPVPRNAEAFVRMLQSQVLDAIFPVWNHPMFPNCHPGFISSIVSLVTHVYCGVGDVKRNRNAVLANTNQRFIAPPPDEATIATIVEMGFTRERAEEALRRVETNSVEMAMEWLFNHVEDPEPDDNELARALALSLGNTSETSKVDSTDKSVGILPEEGQANTPPVDEILAAATKLFKCSDSLAFTLTDLFITLGNSHKGEDRPRVTSFLIQQLKLCPMDFSKDTAALCMISHTIALLLSEDGSTREIAVKNGIISVAIDMLTYFCAMLGSGNDLPVPKCVTAMLLILDNLLQLRTGFCANSSEPVSLGFVPDSSIENASLPLSKAVAETNSTPDGNITGQDNDSADVFEKIFGKPTGYLTVEECCKVLAIVCNLIKQPVPSAVMQAVLQLCARLTKTHALALLFLENEGLLSLFNLPRNSFFPGYDILASSIIRHLLEDPQTLQSAMEMEIRQTLSSNRHTSRIYPRVFLTSMAPVMSRDPEIFMRAVAAICHLETSGARTVVVLAKEREKDKSKASGVEHGVSSNDPIRISESKTHEGTGKCSKGYKKIPPNLAQVMDQLFEMVLKFPSPKVEEDCKSHWSAMEVDGPTTKVKGKSKIGETNKVDGDNLSERSAALAKMCFILRLLSDILQMYSHVVNVFLKRDQEMCQLRGSNQLECPGSGGILYHFLHQLLPLSTYKSAGPDEWREKLSENASWFLVVLCGRSSEGRRRVIHELFNILSSLYSENESSKSILLPNKKVFIFVDLVYSILSKNSSSGNLPISGCSPDVARSMIDGGMVRCLSGILQVLDLDHPDAPKTVNLILKALECLTRVANASEQITKADGLTKKKTIGSDARSEDQITSDSGIQLDEPNQTRTSQQEVLDTVVSEQQSQRPYQNENNDTGNPSYSLEEEMRTEVEENVRANPSIELGMDIIRDEMEENGSLHETNQIEMTFHVENRVGDDMGDEDDDMADDGEDDEDDDEGEDEDEEIGADGTALMSLADTDVEDHDDTGLGDEYNDDMVDEEDDDFHENHIIEGRWREALDGLDHLHVPGRPGSSVGLIDISAEPFEGVNVDDLFGLHRQSMGLERHRQPGRSSFERSVPEGSGPQHPLLIRPSQSGDLVSTWSLSGNSVRDLDPPSSRNYDIAHFYSFDVPALPYDNATANMFSDRMGGAAPPPLADISVGLESLRMPGHRGHGNGRWTDDGQPQASGQASSIAQAVEEYFISHLRTSANSPDRLQQNIEVMNGHLNSQTTNNVQQMEEGNNVAASQNDVREHDTNRETMLQEIIPPTEGVSCQERVDPDVAVEQNQDVTLDTSHVSRDSMAGLDIMNIGDENVNNEQAELTPSLATSSTFGQLDPQGEMGSEVLRNLNDILQQGVHLDMADSLSSTNVVTASGDEMLSAATCLQGSGDVDMSGAGTEENHTDHALPSTVLNVQEPSLVQNAQVDHDASQTQETGLNNNTANTNGIDPTFLEALPEDLRAEVLASQQAQASHPASYTPPVAEDIDPEFLAALPPDIQAEVLAQQQAQRVVQQAEGQPVEMDNASIIATFPADLREEVLLYSSDAVLSALPSTIIAEARMLRDRAMSHYHARGLFGTGHRLNGRRNGLGLDRQTIMDRGVGVPIGPRASSSLAETLKLKDVEGEPLLDIDALKALIRLLRLTQPLGKGLLQRLLLSLCAHSGTRENLICLLLDMIKPEFEGTAGGRLKSVNSQRLYGCQSNIVYGRSQFFDGIPPLVLRRVLEILTYLATNHSAVANALFYHESSLALDSSNSRQLESKNHKGKEKIVEGTDTGTCQKGDIPFVLLLELLSRPLFLQSTAHLEQVMSLIQVVVYTAASKLDFQSHAEQAASRVQKLSGNEADSTGQRENNLSAADSNQDNGCSRAELSTSDKQKSADMYGAFLQLPRNGLRNLCNLLGREGLTDKVYLRAGEVLNKLASVAIPHRRFFILELSDLAHVLSGSAVRELITLKNTNMLGLSAGSMAGVAILRVLQTLNSLTSLNLDAHKGLENVEEKEEHSLMWKLNVALEPLWRELSDCISSTETELSHSSSSSVVINANVGEYLPSSSSLTPSLPPATQRLLPFIEAFFVLCEKSQANNSILQQDPTNATAREVKESAGSLGSLSVKFGSDYQRNIDVAVTFAKFAEKHRQLLNAFIRQNPGLLEKSLSMMLKAPRLIDFDNKRAYFRSRVRQQHDQNLSGPLRISVRRSYILEDSYNQLRMRPTQDLKGRLNVHFQGEEGIDAGGLTREWYQLLSRVVFDKGALLFTTVGNNATFQPNPNSAYQTEHLSYFKFVGRVVAKALFDGQLLDVYFTRSFYKHILGVKVTYHDIEAVDPGYYKNLKWMLENDVSDIPDLTFSMDPDEEKQILYEKTEVTDYELKPGGRNIRVTEETKHEYVDLVAEHILTNAIRRQITSFLEGFNELVPRELISIFNDKELELLISGLPEIDLDDLKANTEYTGYTAASSVVQWFWVVVKAFNKEDMARLLQFVTGTSKVPLEGFKALQGISGPQRFQIHKAYGAPDRLPSAHTCFNQLDLPEYTSKDQLQKRLLLAIHEASEGFGFG